MIIFHISGSPGSGKTTLGRDYKEFNVVDTDELISDEEGLVITQLQNIGKKDEAVAKWKEIFLRNLRIVAYKAQGKVLIFTGILNHYSPDGSILEMPFDNVHKFFIDIAPEQLLRQFYGRYTKELKDDEEFWSGVSEGRYIIPSSAEYLKANREEKQWHLEHGYLALSIQEIRKRLDNKKWFGCANCNLQTEGLCTFCTTGYCSTNCQKDHWVKLHQNVCKWELIFDASGFFIGTSHHVTIFREKFTSKNFSSHLEKTLSRHQINELCLILEEYMKDGSFHPETEKDHPRGGDIGISRFIYRGLYADPSDVPKLSRFLLLIDPDLAKSPGGLDFG